ncbi:MULTISPECIES: hypothetical protein [Aliagarivorans]|nr:MULTISPECIES: hypothetical protein [Aliagarivorans]
MADAHSLLPAIEILMCHTGASFIDACEELGIDPQEMSQYRDPNHEDEE